MTYLENKVYDPQESQIYLFLALSEGSVDCIAHRLSRQVYRTGYFKYPRDTALHTVLGRQYGRNYFFESPSEKLEASNSTRKLIKCHNFNY